MERFIKSTRGGRKDEKETLDKVSKALVKEIKSILKEFKGMTEEEIIEQRYQNFRHMGEYVNL